MIGLKVLHSNFKLLEYIKSPVSRAGTNSFFLGIIMGLDQYVMAGKPGEEPQEIIYWRKHNAMHNWFTKKAIELKIVKHPSEFNCVKLFITQEMLNELKEDIKNKKLEPVDGFFFGSTDYDPAEEMEADLEDISKIQSKLDSNYEVFYDSWW